MDNGKPPEDSGKVKPPESLDEAIKRFFARVWILVTGGPFWRRILTALFIVVVILALARIRMLGDPAYRYAMALFPFQIAMVDEAEAAIPLAFSYEGASAMGIRRAGKLGETFQTGDTLYLSFSVGVPCWVTVFCIDGKGIQPVFGEGLNPVKVEKGVPYSVDFTLNDTLGTEIYYAVARGKKFAFEQDIKPHLSQRFPKLNSKGPAISQYDLKLPSDYRKKWIYFEHAASNLISQ